MDAVLAFVAQNSLVIAGVAAGLACLVAVLAMIHAVKQISRPKRQEERQDASHRLESVNVDQRRLQAMALIIDASESDESVSGEGSSPADAIARDYVVGKQIATKLLQPSSFKLRQRQGRSSGKIGFVVSHEDRSSHVALAGSAKVSGENALNLRKAMKFKRS